jgi:hypothetical protein
MIACSKSGRNNPHLFSSPAHSATDSAGCLTFRTVGAPKRLVMPFAGFALTRAICLHAGTSPVDEAQATIDDLQTKLGRASLAQTELQATARRDQDAIATVQAELRATYERLATADAARENLQQRLSAIEAAYADERSARQQAERAQRDAEAGRTVAERRLRQLDLTAGEPVERTARWPGRPVKATNATTPAKPRDMARRGEAQPLAGLPEPEPVQWWLTSVKKTQRR